MALIDDAVAALQRQWDSQADAIERSDDPDKLHFGNVEYNLPGGWKVVVFIDAGDWDYIDHIVAPDGTVLDSDNVPKDDPDGIWHSIFNWSPRVEDERWGKFR